jgi:hypothetical protein
MANIEMTSLVESVRAFELLGEAPVIEIEVGSMGGAEVASVADVRAKADAELVRCVLSQVRDTNGMGKPHVDEAERLFGELLASGKPLSGREVAAVITTSIRSLQVECDPETAMQTLEEFAQTLQNVPLHKLKAEDFPPGLASVNERQVESFVQENIVEQQSQVQETNASQREIAQRPTPNIDAARQDLLQFREVFGGTPHYPDGNPTYGRSSRKFFGIPLEACQNWFQKQIDNGGILKGFWKTVGKAFGLNDTPPTRFEKASLFIESMRLLSANRDRIVAAFLRSEGEGQMLMSELTRLACHPSSNGGAEGMIRNIDNSLELFETQYANAKSRGELQEFYSALDGVCFENRMTVLTEYALSHADIEPAAEVPQAEGTFKVLPQFVANHGASDTMLETLSREYSAIAQSNPDVEFTWENISTHLKNTVVGMVRSIEENGETVVRAITAEDIDNLREALNEDFYFED